jgi:glycosyltransferase involved in cell wall biosynthesis
MAKILVVNRRVPWPLQDGNSLRVFQLAKHLDPAHACHLACLHNAPAGLAELREQGVFRTITLLPPFPKRRHWLRHLRRADKDYHRFAYPGFFATVVRALQDLVDREAIDIVVATLTICEEFVRPLRGVIKVLDQYDSATLALERDRDAERDLTPVQRLRRRRQLRRLQALESQLEQRCDLVTAISPPDQTRLQALNPQGPPVRLVPNGVDAALLRLEPTTEPAERGVAFWGNLSFPVNRLAVDYFYRKIWLPWLQPAGVRWAIVGPHAGVALQAMANQHPEIELPGFVDDLFGYLARYPVMVNPMRNGTGLKNKVLEAMAAGKAVVSTSLGVDAFPFLDGVHGRLADDAGDFAAAVLELLDHPPQRQILIAGARDLVRSRYTWEAVGSLWSEILAYAGGVQSR